MIEEYLNKKLDNLSDGLNTCTIAEIVNVDLKYMRADVRLLHDDSMVMQVPITPHQTKQFVMRMPYAKGDTVIVLFAQNDNDPFLYGDGKASERQHAIDDAVIVAGVADYNSPLPFDGYEEDLVISKRDCSAKIIIQESGEILIESAQSINVKGTTINLN